MTESPDLQFVEGLFFQDNRYFLMTGGSSIKVPHCDDIAGRSTGSSRRAATSI